ncbi:glycosyltransferase [Streptomyces oryzae]|uniref:D-inositol 3-phosphate glycosyltransferase n=1 Tax=Streptomyces oryzae TaxID=1434886 RepID=A0ABS3XKA6_9ACTN|nr:glycosyltransferase [Streptomyces oryzae]MBO8195745.1 glycosyltransferase [Streptomyces oryzae]
MKIVFLLDNAYGIGGTIRSTVNLSGALADRHQVEVVSLRRSRQDPALAFDPRVTLTPLIELRSSAPGYDGDDPDFHRPSERFTEGRDHFERGIATRLGDLRVRELLQNLEADVVIGTRPKINDYLAAYGTDRYVRIGQEHLTHAMHSGHIRSHQDAALAHLDAFVTVSYADAAAYRAALPEVRTEIVCVPNAVPAPRVEPSDGQAKLIVAAGRLIKVKRYDRLLRAFALVADKHPDWSLRLYGRGPQHDALRDLRDELGLYDRAFLMGAHSPIETEWAKGSVAAVSSDAESFGMTLVEAMHCGVPVVSTDCPYGPGEIIANGKDGLLAPLGEDEGATVRGYADALLHLVEDPALRTRMSAATLEKAARYCPQRVAGEYEHLMARLLEGRPGAGAGVTASAGPKVSAGPNASAGAPRSEPVAAPSSGPAAPAAPSARPAPSATSAPSAPSAPSASSANQRSSGGRARVVRTARRLVPRALIPLLRPLARALRLRRGGGARGHGTAKGLPRPVAHVRVERDGALLVRLRADSLPRSAAVLALRPRHRDGAEPVRVPVPPREQTGADGWAELRLSRAEVELFEARWDAYVERTSDGGSKRVKAAMVETARLLTLPPPVTPDGTVQPWIPYTTSEGHLALRVWSRARHAEVTAIELGEHGFRLTARLYGTGGPQPPLSQRTVELSGGPLLLAVPRDDPRQAFEFPGRQETADPDGSADGSVTVRLELPFDLPAAFADGSPQAVWDLWLRPGLGPERVRLGRLLGDLADRKKTDVTPPARLDGTDQAVQLYFSVNNNLVLSLRTVTSRTAEPTAGQGAEPATGQGTAAADAQSAQGRSSSPSASAGA